MSEKQQLNFDLLRLEMVRAFNDCVDNHNDYFHSSNVPERSENDSFLSLNKLKKTIDVLLSISSDQPGMTNLSEVLNVKEPQE